MKHLKIKKQNKNKLQKLGAAHPTTHNISKYVTFRNVYNKIVRASKKLYFEFRLKNCVNDPKKTWGTLKEAINLKKSSSNIEKISVNGTQITDNKCMVDEFTILESKYLSQPPPPIKIKPEDSYFSCNWTESNRG